MGKRVFVFVVLGLLTLFGLLHPLMQNAQSSHITDPVTITDYKADSTIGANGTLVTTEHITASFPSGRHGIFRFFDISDTDNPHVRLIPEVATVTMDGAPEPYTQNWEGQGRFLVLKIGDANSYVGFGTHNYTISYSIPGVLAPVSAGAQQTFTSTQGQPSNAQSVYHGYVVAPGWQLDIDKAEVDVQLPGIAEQVQCTAGAGIASAITRGPCDITGVGTDEVTLSASNIPPFSGMNTRISLPTPAPKQVTVPWAVKWDPILGRTPWVVALVGVLTAIGAFMGYRWAHTTKEETPGLPVMYEPPHGLGPVQTVFITNEEVGSHALTATLFYLADQKAVTLEHREDDSWLATSTGDAAAWSNLDPVTAEIAGSLNLSPTAGTWFLADGSKDNGQNLLTAQRRVPGQAENWSMQSGLVMSAPRERLGKFLWFASIVCAAIAFFMLGPTMWGLPFAAFGLAGVGFLRSGVGMRRTATGREAWSRAGGFERLLSTPSAEDRFDFAARKDLFISFIPYAVAFGVADKWAQKYRMAMNSEPPVPMWYPVMVGTNMSPWSNGSGGFGDIDRAINSSISNYQASQVPSGGSGGGFGSIGGGGGGGGGGGSW